MGDTFIDMIGVNHMQITLIVQKNMLLFTLWIQITNIFQY